MSNLFRTAIVAVTFTIAVIFFIDYAGNMMTKSGAKSNPHAILKTPVVKKTPKKQKQKPKIVRLPKSINTAQTTNKKPVLVTARTADATQGYKTFKRKCLGCHTVNKAAPNRTGPNLWGVVGRVKGAKKGFRYSKGLKRLGGVWTEADINRFIAGPRSMVRDTKMTFRGLKTRPDRQDIIAFLKTLKD